MNNYAKAYTEVLEIITFLPEDEAEKIPLEKINFFMENRDKDYNFKYDDTISFDENNIMIETKAIFVELFRDYFASETQKEKLSAILKQNEIKKQQILNEKYSYENIFKKNDSETNGKKENIQLNNDSNNTVNDYDKQVPDDQSLIPIEKINVFKRIINKIREILKKH